MRVLASGSSGLIGGSVVAALQGAGHTPVRMVRRAAKGIDEIHWDPPTGRLDPAPPGDAPYAVIHLAGEPVAGRWTDRKKQAIRDSRALATGLLARELATLPQPPASLLCASAIGIYGDRGDELLTEDSPPGAGFLAAVCRQWEQSCVPAADAGIRVVHLRFGLVLSRHDGALKAMLPAFRMGLGGVLGHGRQYWSWITLEDAVRAILRLMEDESIRGPVNVVAPSPVTNREFTKALGAALHRPTLFRLPEALLRLLGGQMAQEMLLSGQRAAPRRLEAMGFSFQHTRLPKALAAVLEDTVRRP